MTTQSEPAEFSIDPRLQELYDQSTEFAQRSDVLQALSMATWNSQLWLQAQRETHAFFESQGIDIPNGLRLGAIEHPLVGKPMPGYETFSIRLFNCRTLWLKKLDGAGYEPVEFCRGFEIVPHPIPGGPIGRQ